MYVYMYTTAFAIRERFIGKARIDANPKLGLSRRPPVILQKYYAKQGR